MNLKDSMISLTAASTTEMPSHKKTIIIRGFLITVIDAAKSQ